LNNLGQPCEFRVPRQWNASQLLGGSWYSTQQGGQCGVDKGCSWRVVEVVKTVNASCVDSNIFSAVRARNERCFQGCGADAYDISSDCWITCFCKPTQTRFCGEPAGLSRLPAKKPNKLMRAESYSNFVDTTLYGTTDGVAGGGWMQPEQLVVPWEAGFTDAGPQSCPDMPPYQPPPPTRTPAHVARANERARDQFST
jgi:hypothetical protein